MSEGEQETKRIRCNCCGSRTNHVLRARYTWFRKLDDDDAKLNLADLPENIRLLAVEGKLDNLCKHENSIWACAGCDTVTFEWQLMYPSVEKEGKWEEHASDVISTIYDISMLPKVFRMNSELSQLYREVLTSFSEDCLLLCTIGLRALIEGVCVDKGLREGNLEQKIEGLLKFLPNVNVVEALHTFRSLGNDAAHRFEAMTREEAKMAIEVVEDLLKFLYDLDYKASQVTSISRKPTIKSAKLGSVQ